jgi:hypothetical protein
LRQRRLSSWREVHGFFLAAILMGAATGVFAALLVAAQSAPDVLAQTAGYFVYGLIVLCGGLLVLLIRQN